MSQAHAVKQPIQALRDDLADSVYEKSIWNGRQTDGLLQWLVQMINTTQLDIDITLSMGNGVVTGKLISLDDYFEQLAADFAEPFRATGGPEEQAIRAGILGLKPQQPGGDDPVAPQFIHLQLAQTYLAGEQPIPTVPGVLWRGKISAVEGFTLGSIAQE